MDGSIYYFGIWNRDFLPLPLVLTYITMRLSAGVPLPTVAANTDTSMKYIQEHYFHYRADESTEILGKGRKIKPAEESLRWIGSS